MSAVRRLEFKFKIFMEAKSDEETTRTETVIDLALSCQSLKEIFWRSIRMGDI